MINDTEFQPFLELIKDLNHTPSQVGLEQFRLKMGDFLREILIENEKVNLTAIRDWEGALWKHGLDSLSVAKLGLTGRVLDWGTGGGFPGVPLFLFREHILGEKGNVTLCDSIGKKLAAIERALDRAGIKGLEFANCRGEVLIKQEKYDACVLRAVAKPDLVAKWISNRVPTWAIMTGPMGAEAWRAELPKISKRHQGKTTEFSFNLPFDQGSRTLFRLDLPR